MGGAEAGVIGGDANVAATGNFQSAANARAIYLRDHRDREFSQRTEGRRHAFLVVRQSITRRHADLQKFFKIATCREGRGVIGGAFARDAQATQVFVGRQFVQTRLQLMPHRKIDGVQFAGIGDDQGRETGRRLFAG